MNKTRLKVVAHALATADKEHDPGFDYSRYAVTLQNPAGPDVALNQLGPGVVADIAAWTCYQYPDLCVTLGDSWRNQGLFYYYNARSILGLEAKQADDLFLNLDQGQGVSRNEAILALEKLAHSSAQ